MLGGFSGVVTRGKCADLDGFDAQGRAEELKW